MDAQSIPQTMWTLKRGWSAGAFGGVHQEVHASNKSLVDMALLWRSKLPMRSRSGAGREDI